MSTSRTLLWLRKMTRAVSRYCPLKACHRDSWCWPDSGAGELAACIATTLCRPLTLWQASWSKACCIRNLSAIDSSAVISSIVCPVVENRGVHHLISPPRSRSISVTLSSSAFFFCSSSRISASSRSISSLVIVRAVTVGSSAPASMSASSLSSS